MIMSLAAIAALAAAGLNTAILVVMLRKSSSSGLHAGRL
jgi:hypothetical protein